MGSDIIQAQYEQLEQIAVRFGQQAEAAAQTTQRAQQSMRALQAGGWEGRGAAAFFGEMERSVLPSMQRLSGALQQSQTVTRQIGQLMRAAEEEASRPFRGDGAAPGTAPAEQGGGFWGAVGDFFTGAGAELKDMATGLWNLVTDPVGTAKGLWHGITHPGELWNAIKQPYVEAWESGHPWQAIGRGAMFVGSILIGTKGADKAAKAAKASRAARVAQEATAVGARYGNVADDVARSMGSLAKGSRAETAAARYVASRSTQTFGGPLADRVVLGPFKPNPATGFRGYIGEAQAQGGRVFNTPGNVWNTLRPDLGGNGRIWSVNREFLQAQMERGVARIELRGGAIDDILRTRPTSYSAAEIRYLQRYGYEYGYRLDGNAWVKVGDWRASTTGRFIGGSAGPVLDIIEDATR
jgi:WXG100 family type VII secretion target